MTTATLLRRLRLLERFASPIPVDSGPRYVLIRTRSARLRDDETHAPIGLPRLTDDDINGCTFARQRIDRLPGESVDAMCIRARAALWRSPDGIPVMLATYA